MNVDYTLFLVLTFLFETFCSVDNTKPIELKSNTVADSRTFTGPFVSFKRKSKRSAGGVSNYTAEQAAEIVAKHNEYRKQEGASGMEYMVCIMINAVDFQ